MPVDGNSRIIAAAKQVAKGTPNTTSTHFFMLSGDGALNPNREIITLPETDSSSQRAGSRVVGASPGGGFSFWMRASQWNGMLAEAIMGAVSGTTTKTATPTKTLPYYTLFDIIPGEQCTQYNDVRFSSLAVSGQSLQGIQCTAECVGLEAVLGATPPTIVLPTDDAYAYPYVTVTVGAVHPGTHDAFTLTINRNVTLLRGDMGLEAFDSFPGLFDVTVQLQKIYANDDDYRKVHGGAAAATTLTTDIFTESLSILIAEDANNSVDFQSDAIEYTSITVPVNVDGSPIIQTLEGFLPRQAVWADALTVVAKKSV